MKKNLLLLAFFLAVFASCSKDKTVNISELQVGSKNITLQINALDTIKAVIVPANASNPQLNYSSSDLSVATVNTSGVIKGIKAGVAIITVKGENSNISTQITVTVTTVFVSSILLDNKSLTVKTGNKAILTATISPLNATDATMVWSSSDTKIAIVDQNGVITGVAEGLATISVKSSDGKSSATCVVTVVPAYIFLELNKPYTAYNGLTLTLTMMNAVKGSHLKYGYNIAWDVVNNTSGRVQDFPSFLMRQINTNTFLRSTDGETYFLLWPGESGSHGAHFESDALLDVLEYGGNGTGMLSDASLKWKVPYIVL